MSVLMIEGFDTYNGLGANTGLIAKWNAPGGSGQSMITGRFSGQAWRLQPAIGQAIQRTFTATPISSIAVGSAIRLTNLFSATPTAKAHLCLVNSTGTVFQCGIIFDTNGSISAYRVSGDVSGTLLGSSAANVMAANTWHYVEVEFVISATVGRVTVYVDGVQKLNLTGVNTANGGATVTADSLRLSSTNGGNGNGGFIDYDDIYVVDAAAKLGERRVETLRPSADTAQKDWTPDTGTVNFSRVNDTLADGTTFVQASVVGNLDLYDIVDLSSTPAAIDAVNIIAYAQKTDATTRAIQLAAKLSATTVTSADNNLAASIARFDSLLLTKPGGGAWAATDVNALQIGPKVSV